MLLGQKVVLEKASQEKEEAQISQKLVFNKKVNHQNHVIGAEGSKTDHGLLHRMVKSPGPTYCTKMPGYEAQHTNVHTVQST